MVVNNETTEKKKYVLNNVRTFLCEKKYVTETMIILSSFFLIKLFVNT